MITVDSVQRVLNIEQLSEGIKEGRNFDFLLLKNQRKTQNSIIKKNTRNFSFHRLTGHDNDDAVC